MEHDDFPASRRRRSDGITESTLPLPLILAALLLLITAAAEAERADSRSANRSRTAALIWSSSVDEADLLTNSEIDNDDPSEFSADNIDGGFSTLDGMLQWAIGHSDPDKLKQSAQDIQRMSPDELENRRVRIKELMANLKMPSDAELMRIAVNDLKNESTSLQDRKRALEELLILVEPIDNANGQLDEMRWFIWSLCDSFFPDLFKLGGLAAVIRHLDHSSIDIRILSAWIIGKACQNNPIVQDQVLELSALPTLMSMVRSDSAEEAAKSLYAVSALIRNNPDGRKSFYSESGVAMLQDIFRNSSVDIRLCRKAMFLTADLAENVPENETHLSGGGFLKSVVGVAMTFDLDLLEKTLVAMKNLLLLESTEAAAFEEVCRLEDVLDRVREHLQRSMEEDEGRRTYATELEILRTEVRVIYHRKKAASTTVAFV